MLLSPLLLLFVKVQPVNKVPLFLRIVHQWFWRGDFSDVWLGLAFRIRIIEHCLFCFILRLINFYDVVFLRIRVIDCLDGRSVRVSDMHGGFLLNLHLALRLDVHIHLTNDLPGPSWVLRFQVNGHTGTILVHLQIARMRQIFQHIDCLL